MMAKRIPGRGPTQADVLFLSSAPGHYEQAAGRAFAGPAGTELDKMVALAGLTYKDCRYDNLCREVLLDSKAREAYDYTAWYADLIDRINAVKPKVIVPLGDPALVALTGRHGILKWRGSILDCTLVPGIKVIPTIDPAFLLRGSWQLRQPCIWDLKRVVEEKDIEGLNQPEWDFQIRPSEDTVHQAFERLWGAKEIVFDIEGSGNILCIGLGDGTNWAICIPFFRSDGSLYWGEAQEIGIWKELARLLQSDIDKVAQNEPFDHIHLRVHGIDIRGQVWDTMKMHLSVWPELPHSLAFLTSVYTRQQYYKDEGKTWESGVSEDRFWTYNCLDVGCTGMVKHQLLGEMNDLGVADHHRRHLQNVRPILIDAELDGITIHKGRQAKHVKKVEADLARLEPELEKKVGRPINVRSPIQMKELIEKDLGLKVPFNRKTGKTSVDEDALNEIMLNGHSELLGLILEIRGARVLKSTFVEPKLGIDGRMRCHYSHTETMRLKSGKSVFGTGMNLQNQPETVRDMYVVDDPAFLFGQYDLSQAEDRWVAYTAPVPMKQQLYREGKKVHTFFASIISEAYTGKHLDYKQIPKDNSPKSLYFTAKRTVHGNNYDLGLKKFSLLILQPVNIARTLQEIYHRTFPEISRVWWPRVQQQLKADRTIRNPDGSARIFLDRFDDNLYRQAYAHEPQEGVCYHMNQTLCVLYYGHKAAMDCKTAFFDFLQSENLTSIGNFDDMYHALRESQMRIKLQVHDSGLFQAVAATVPLVAQLADHAANRPITGLIGGPFIIPAEHEVGPAWGIKRPLNPYATDAAAMCERMSRVYQMAIKKVIGRRKLCTQNQILNVSGSM